MTKGEIAEQNFYSGYNCSQAVAAAFADELNMPKEQIARLTIGFGGGMGRLREVCGTISGAVFVLSALYGDRDKSVVYKMVQDIAAEFEKQNGSIICRQLFGLEEKTPVTPQAEARTPEYYKKRPCPQLARLTADILAEYLNNLK